MNEPFLAAPVTYVFGGQHVDRLVKVLKEQQAHAELLPVTSAADLQINQYARVRGTYKYTTLAYSQICQKLSRGLILTLGSLAGFEKQANDTDDLTDQALAIRIFNDVAALRWKRLKDWRLVVDRKLGVVEGLVGKRYMLLPNNDLFTKVAAFVGQHATRPAVLDQALLCGRRLLARFRNTQPLFTIDHPDGRREDFFGGYQIENAEVGTVALRAGSVIIRGWCGGKAITPLDDCYRVTHVRGKAFSTRFRNLLTQLDSKQEQPEDLKQRVLAMREQSLGLGITRARHDARYENLIRFLGRHSLGRPLAEKVLKRVLVLGSYRGDKLTAGASPLTVYARRTVYDLYNSLTNTAKDLPLSGRIAAETLAFQLITSKLNPV